MGCIDSNLRPNLCWRPRSLIAALFTGIGVILALGFTSTKVTGVKASDSPEAAGRTYGQNYKDMVLSLCIATAYQQDASTAADAGSSFGALRDWTHYDLEKSPEEIKRLVDKYLRRDYENPLAEAEHKNIKFSLLKCLDMYNSKELEQQMTRFAPQPKRTYRQDYPPKP